MYIAMNRFKVIKGSEAEFETVWRNRDRHLDEMEGFVAFHLLRGPETDDHTLYSSHAVWRTRDNFVAWTQSEQFRQTHRHVGERKVLFQGHPQFEGFEVLEGI